MSKSRGQLVARLSLTWLLVTGGVLAGASGAAAAGTGGVDVSPDPAVGVDGKAISAFHLDLRAGGPGIARFVLRNVESHPVAAQLYAAAVTRAPNGAFAVGGPGSAPWIGLRNSTVRLAPHAAQRRTFAVDPARAPHTHGTVYGALVVQTASGSVIQRAAVLVYLAQRAGVGAPAGLPWPPLAVAAFLVAALSAGLAVVRGRQLSAAISR